MLSQKIRGRQGWTNGSSESLPRHGGIAKPGRNRKGESGSPPPKANASEFYPNL